MTTVQIISGGTLDGTILIAALTIAAAILIHGMTRK